MLTVSDNAISDPSLRFTDKNYKVRSQDNIYANMESGDHTLTDLPVRMELKYKYI